MNDRRSAANSSSGKCFTTLCYSADGSYILAGGNSRYICMYDVADQKKSFLVPFNEASAQLGFDYIPLLPCSCFTYIFFSLVQA
ncbi:hypothetical protein V6N13_128128 [Hibiscus sabdariffa]